MLEGHGDGGTEGTGAWHRERSRQSGGGGVQSRKTEQQGDRVVSYKNVSAKYWILATNNKVKRNAKK